MTGLNNMIVESIWLYILNFFQLLNCWPRKGHLWLQSSPNMPHTVSMRSAKYRLQVTNEEGHQRPGNVFWWGEGFPLGVLGDFCLFGGVVSFFVWFSLAFFDRKIRNFADKKLCIWKEKEKERDRTRRRLKYSRTKVYTR